MGKRKFKIGQFYDFSDWFDRNVYRYTVRSVADDTVWFDVYQLFIENPEINTVSKVICKDMESNEYVLLYILDDNEARIYADIIN